MMMLMMMVMLTPEMVVPVDELLLVAEVEFPPKVEEVHTSVRQAATL